MTTPPIGVFDSGLGGLTVLRALIDLLPDERIVYFGDTGRFPYGPKPREEVLAHALEITDVLLGHDVKALVVACNSAAAAALDPLRQRLTIPVIGVIEPGLRAAARATRSGRVGVIGTVATITSGAYEDAFAAAPSLKLTLAACPRFVELVEDGVTSGDELLAVAHAYLDPVAGAGVDTLVLGCTHYPLLTGVLSYVMGDGVTLVSSAEETAKDVYRTLAETRQLRPAGSPPPDHRFLATGDPESFRRLGRRFLGPEVVAVGRADLATSVWAPA